jgi:DNA-binding IclR family transcriptional regulator
MADDEDEVVITSDGRRIRPVKSVTRAVQILDVLSVNGEPMGLTELAAAVGCSKTAAYNLVTTLELRGLVRKSSDHRYVLGWKLLEWGEVVHSSATFGEAALAQLVVLSEATGETAMMAVLDGETMMCVELVESSRSVPLSISRGSREVATADAAGQILLAFSPVARRRRLIDRFDTTDEFASRLDSVRAEGIAVVAKSGEVAVAAPVFDYSGDVVAAVAVLGPKSRLPDPRVHEIVRAVSDAGTAITVTLGGGRHRRALAGSA